MKKGARGVKGAERLSMGGLTACPNYSKGGLKMQQIMPAVWRQGKPEKDGIYLVIWRLSHQRDAVTFTTDGGWNTHREDDGSIFTEHALSDDTFILWLDVEDPQEVTP